MTCTFDILTGNGTDKGKEREENQDYYGYYEDTPYGSLWVICDGMGGAAGGRTASVMAVETIRDTFQEEGHEDDIAAIQTAVSRANQAIYERGQKDFRLSGMGTTAVILVIKNGQARTAHVGDSRIYLVRDERIRQLTKDHSWVQERIDDGSLTEEEARTHENSHVITRSIGVAENVDCEIGPEPVELQLDDCLVLCSDGLSSMVSDDLICEYVWRHDPLQACNELIDLANENGGIDNITVQVVKVVPEGSLSPTWSQNFLSRLSSFFSR